MVGALITLSLTACSKPVEPAPQAKALAQTLETGKRGDTNWADGGTADLEAALGELVDLPRKVAVTRVGDPRDVSDQRVSDVTLEWSWDLDSDGITDWTSPGAARLVTDKDGNWTSVFDTAMVAGGLRPGGSLAVKRTTGERGYVLDRDGVAIVTERPVVRVGIDKTRIADASEANLRESAEAVAKLAGLDDPVKFGDRAVAAGPKAFVEAIVVRTDSAEIDLEAVRAVPGGVALGDEIRLAPTTDFARPILGRSGEAPKDIIEESKGRIAPGDVTGLSGLQKEYDAVVAGKPGLQVVERLDPDDKVLFERPATDGQDLKVSLSIPAQEKAEAALAGIPQPSGLVVLRPSTGEIVAAASGPGSEGRNTAMTASVAPGSTYKVVTALALLRAGVGSEGKVSCTPEAKVDGYTFSNDPGYPASELGEITMTKAIAHSCNTAMVNSRDKLSPAGMAEASEALGLGRKVPGAWPGFMGSYPGTASGTGLAASLIGQGEVLASPLAMATVAASVQSGTTVTPTLLLGPGDITDATGPPAPSVPLTKDEAKVVQDEMAAVVSEGTANLLADVPGTPVHAKTGSAQAGEGDDARVDSWMIAYQDDLAIAVLVQGGGHGSGAAGGVVKELLTTIE